MSRPLREPSHPIVGWAWATIGSLGLVFDLLAYLVRCSAGSVSPWPLEAGSLEILASVVRWTFPGAVLLVLGVLLPLQRWAGRPERQAILVRVLTGTLLAVLGAYWILRLNLVGYASLWARREVLGDFVLPAALLENRVWSSNIMLVFATVMLSLPLAPVLHRMLGRQWSRRAPWPLWVLAGVWWVGLVAVLLIAGQ